MNRIRKCLLLSFIIANLLVFPSPLHAASSPMKDANASGNNAAGTLVSASPSLTSDQDVQSGNAIDEGECLDASNFPNSVTITSISFSIKTALGSPTGTLTGRIYSIAAGCSNVNSVGATLKATSTNTIAMNTIPGSYTTETFNFNSVNLGALTTGNSYVFAEISSACGCNSGALVTLGTGGANSVIGGYTSRSGGNFANAALKDTAFTVTGINSQITASLTTTNPSEIVILGIFANGNTGTSVSDTSSLTWSKRASAGQLSEYWATSTGILSSDTITVSFTSGSAVGAITAITFSSIQFASPFDPNSNNPSSVYSAGCNPSTSSVLSFGNEEAVALFASDTASPSITTTTGYNLLATTTNAPVGHLAETGVGTQSTSGTFASPCSGSNNSGVIADVLCSSSCNQGAGSTTQSSTPPPNFPFSTASVSVPGVGAVNVPSQLASPYAWWIIVSFTILVLAASLDSKELKRSWNSWISRRGRPSVRLRRKRNKFY